MKRTTLVFPLIVAALALPLRSVAATPLYNIQFNGSDTTYSGAASAASEQSIRAVFPRPPRS